LGRGDDDKDRKKDGDDKNEPQSGASRRVLSPGADAAAPADAAPQAGGPASAPAVDRPRLVSEATETVIVAAALAGSAAIAIVVGRPPGGVIVTAAFTAALAGISLVDLRERRIPNAYTYGGTAVALAVALPGGVDAIGSSLLGIGFGGGVMGAGFWVGRGQLGLGDVKLAAFAGAVLGGRATATFLMAGTVFVALAALVLLLRGRDRRSTFAYGPYLAAGAAFAVLVRGPLMS
jgi:leader peptidase (prepilin peptidase)/N-methyltransferase